MKLLLMSLILLFSFSSFALPQNVKLTGIFVSNLGGRNGVSVSMKLKMQDAEKANYAGKLNFVRQGVKSTQDFEFTINTLKNKSEGIANTFDGYIAFDSKSAFTLKVGQKLQLGYSQWQYNNDHICNPNHENFCPPTDISDRIIDEGVLTLTVVQTK